MCWEGLKYEIIYGTHTYTYIEYRRVWGGRESCLLIELHKISHRIERVCAWCSGCGKTGRLFTEIIEILFKYLHLRLKG